MGLKAVAEVSCLHLLLNLSVWSPLRGCTGVFELLLFFFLERDRMALLGLAHRSPLLLGRSAHCLWALSHGGPGPDLLVSPPCLGLPVTNRAQGKGSFAGDVSGEDRWPVPWLARALRRVRLCPGLALSAPRKACSPGPSVWCFPPALRKVRNKVSF